jgi:hypothetical protein
MERLLNQNTYQPKQARYRCLKPLALRDIDRKLFLSLFKCLQTHMNKIKIFKIISS